MGFNSFDNIRSGTGFNILSGILLGFGAFLLKIGFSGASILTSLFSPLTILASVLLVAGFLLLQKALHGGHVSVAAPVSMGLGVAIPVVLSFLFMGDYISLLKWFGIIIILAGIATMPS